MIAAIRAAITESGLWQKINDLKKGKNSGDFVLAPHNPINLINEIVKVVPPDEDSDRLGSMIEVSISDLLRRRISFGGDGGPDVVIFFDHHQKGCEISVHFERSVKMNDDTNKKPDLKYSLADIKKAIQTVVNFVNHEVIGGFPKNVLNSRSL